MLAKRIIPLLLVSGDRLVKGIGFDSTRTVGHVQQAMRVHQQRGVDEMIVLDIDATKEGRGPNADFIRKLTDNFFAPLTIGGGVRGADDVRLLLEAGADKVAINTLAAEHPGRIKEITQRFGSQAIVAAIDVMGTQVMTCCATTRAHSDVTAFAKHMEDCGAGEILLTRVERDGTLNGYDLELIREVTEAVGIPVIVSGGCGTPYDMLQAFEAGASACAAGAMFVWTDWTPRSCAQWLAERGVEVRL